MINCFFLHHQAIELHNREIKIFLNEKFLLGVSKTGQMTTFFVNIDIHNYF